MVKKTHSYPKKLEPLNLHAHRLNGDLIPKTDLTGFYKTEKHLTEKKGNGPDLGLGQANSAGLAHDGAGGSSSFRHEQKQQETVAMVLGLVCLT